jgi:Flp pilus assembly protein TadB
MAKERARRRAERERQTAVRAQQRAAEAARAARRRSLAGRLRMLRPTSRQKPGGPLAARRRARNRLIGAVIVAVQVVGWLWARSWAVSTALLMFTVLVTPALVRLLLDRRD